ncbi:mercury resistance system transport protein MerF [Ahrensia kielensis]|uniref:Mercury resistance system transport protein MerF n=1 Tax=Ahrensia kielensis TaxID=76980 RepID=A0ABU9TBL9_9HYPH
MSNNKLLATGLIGTLIAGLCCFTPILVIFLGIVGLSSIIGYLDYVLLPALGVFILISVYAIWKRGVA